MPALAHIGEMRQCLFVVLEGCVSRLSLSQHRNTQKEVEMWGMGWGLLSNLFCFGLYDHGPHVASTPPWTHTSPSLPFGHRQPLYRLTPAAKICVCAANGGLGTAPNQTMTGDPRRPMFNQSAAYSRPCLAPCAFVDSGLIF